MVNVRTMIMAVALFGAAMIVSSQACGSESVKSGSFYSVKIDKSTQDSKTMARISVSGQGGYHCNMLYPWKLTLKTGDGVTFEKGVFKKGDAEKFTSEEVVFVVSFTAKSGAQLAADLKLSVCNDKECRMETVSLAI